MTAPRSRASQLAELIAARDRLDARIALLARGMERPVRHHERPRPTPTGMWVLDEAAAIAAPDATPAQLERLTVLALTVGATNRKALAERRRRRLAKP